MAVEKNQQMLLGPFVWGAFVWYPPVLLCGGHVPICFSAVQHGVSGASVGQLRRTHEEIQQKGAPSIRRKQKCGRQFGAHGSAIRGYLRHQRRLHIQGYCK